MEQLVLCFEKHDFVVGYKGKMLSIGNNFYVKLFMFKKG